MFNIFIFHTIRNTMHFKIHFHFFKISYSTIFARKEAEPGIKSQISRHDAGAGTVSPFTITGLETGAEYYIYPVVTDTEYDSALTVSQSVAASSVAG